MISSIRQLGCSTGTLARTSLPFLKRVEFFSILGANSLELHFSQESFEFFEELAIGRHSELLEKFSWVSIHAPSTDIPEAISLFEKISQLHFINLVVFHPYLFDDFLLLEKCSLPIGLENMDTRKPSFKRTDLFKKHLDEHPDWGLVLDLNHCYLNDPSGRLAADFLKIFEKQISLVHVSGFEYKNGELIEPHVPLFRTHQSEILENAALIKNLPIIIESECQSKEELSGEFEYISQLIF